MYGGARQVRVRDRGCVWRVWQRPDTTVDATGRGGLCSVNHMWEDDEDEHFYPDTKRRHVPSSKHNLPKVALAHKK